MCGSERSGTMLSMDPDLQRRFDAIEQQRTALKNVTAALGDRALTWNPAPKEWSIGQIVEHLVLGDEVVGTTSRTTEAPAEPLLYRIIPRAARRALVNRALNRDTVLPVPSADVEPSGSIPLAELHMRWQSVREEMHTALKVHPPEMARYAHPILGPLTAAQMLDLGLAHTAYHISQIVRMQQHPNFPKFAG